MAWEEAQGQLQRERAALKEARATLKLRDGEISRLDGELNQLSVSHEDMFQAGEEKDTTNQLSVSHEDMCQAGEEKDTTILDLQKATETALGNSATQALAVQTAYNSLQQELKELRAAALEAC
jgi:hypothetical protein